MLLAKKTVGSGGGRQIRRFPLLQSLLSDVQLLDDRTIALNVNLLQITQQVSSVTNHLGQTATAVVVVGVALEVLGQVVDAVGQNSDLNLGRTGVAFVDRILLDNSLFFLSGHDVFHLSKYIFCKTRVPQRSAGESAAKQPFARRP